MIELNSLTFWLVCAAATLLLVGADGLTVRQRLLAGLNVTFLIALLRWQALGLIAGIFIAFLLLQAVGRPRWRPFMVAVTALALFGLFLLHKLPQVTNHVGLNVVGRTLAVIGYSYVALRMVEVLRAVFERRHPAPSLTTLINYLLPFHMLAAGPIQAYDDYVQQSATFTAPNAREVLIGVERIAHGLFKKFVLAYILQKLVLTDFQSKGLFFLLELQVFFVWLYLDFSAYSDIAAGVGILTGISTPENFNRPLRARNVIDFWDRWHISLSMFIRRNLFTPLQMFFMRQNDGRTPLLAASGAVAISFVLCGLWHGITFGFLMWGVAQACGLIIARLYGHILKKQLGAKNVKLYLANSWIRAAAVVLTFEFEASALVLLFTK